MTQPGLIIVDDVLDGLARMDDNSVDAIVTDPPYDLLQASRKGSGRSNNPDSPAGRHGAKTGGFMGLAWDATGVAFRQETWEACLRVLKPGGYLIAFGGGRTHHRMWCAIEDAGFEVRDMLTWMYGTGFPKSMNVGKAIDKAAKGHPQGTANPDSPGHGKYKSSEDPSNPTGRGMGAGPGKFMREQASGPSSEITDPAAKQWEGYGTALKPAVEPILLARKPLSEPTVAANVLRWGTGAINIEGCRVEGKPRTTHKDGNWTGNSEKDAIFPMPNIKTTEPIGRWPANVIFECTCDDPPPLPEKRKRKNEPAQSMLLGDAEPAPAKPEMPQSIVHQPDCPAGMLDAQTTQLKGGTAVGRNASAGNVYGGGKGLVSQSKGDEELGYGDQGGASRFFYCAKASRAERERGLEDFEPITGAEAVNRKPDTAGLKSPRAGAGRSAKEIRNRHATVKPIALMRWLIRLVTPPGGRILDPFCGSGSTLIAAREERHDFVGIDLSAEYCRIAQARVGGAELVQAEAPENAEPEWED